MRSRGCFGLLALVWVLGATGPGGAADAEPQPEAWTLPNGVRVLFVPAPGAPMTGVVALVGGGAAMETPRSYGSTHLLEHLTFNGTSSLSQEELYAAFDRLGTYCNAATRHDYILFQMLVPGGREPQAAELLAAMLFDSTIPPAAFEKEKGIVLAELRGGSSQAEEVRQTAEAILFAGTHYARRILGTEQQIREIQREDVVAFYRRYFVPGNVTLVVVGPGPADAVRPWVQAAFGKPRRASVKLKPPPVPTWARAGAWWTAPAPDGRWRLIARYPAPAPGEADYGAAVVLAAALDRHVIRMPDLPPLPELSAALDVNRWFTHLEISVPRDETDPVGALVAWRDSADALARTIPDTLDLDALRLNLRFDDASLRDRPHYYPFYRGPEFLVAPTTDMVRLQDAIALVTVADLRAVAARMLGGAHGAVVLAPGGEERALVVPPRTEAPLDAVSEAALAPVPAAEIDVVLPSGLRLQARREPGLEIGAVHLLVEGRSLLEPKGQEGIVELMHRCLLGGTETREEAEVRRALTAMAARIKTHDDLAIPFDDYTLSPAYSYVRMEVLRDYVPDALILLREVLQHPAYPETIVGRERDQLRRDAAAREDRAGGAARAALLTAILGRETPMARAPLGSPEAVAALRPDDLRRFHATYFRPERMILTVVSDVAPERIHDLVAALWAGEPQERAHDEPIPAASAEGSRHELTVAGSQGYLLLGQAVMVDPDLRGALLVGADWVSGRMAQVLREEKGWAYSVGAGIGADGPVPIWMASYSGPDAHLDEAEAYIRDQVQQLREHVLQRDDVALVSSRLVGRRQMRRLTAINRAYFWGLSRLPDLAAATWARVDVSDVTPEAVREAARQALRCDAWTVVRVRTAPVSP